MLELLLILMNPSQPMMVKCIILVLSMEMKQEGHIDSLLDKRILMGSHHRHSAQTIIKPLGYSTLAELVQHVRSMLSLKQLSRVVHIFSCVFHDPSMKLPMPIQFQAVRLLLNLVDIWYQNKDLNPQIGRDLLDMILDTLVSKLGTLKDQIPAVRATALAEMGVVPADTESTSSALSVSETSVTMMSENKQLEIERRIKRMLP